MKVEVPSVVKGCSAGSYPVLARLPAAAAAATAAVSTCDPALVCVFGLSEPQHTCWFQVTKETWAPQQVHHPK
jgi:hypothetical protein